MMERRALGCSFQLISLKHAIHSDGILTLAVGSLLAVAIWSDNDRG
jgi:hypothetical protein